VNFSVAYSPCPNDTFMFHDLATGAVTLPGHTVEVHLHDVETLNRLAMEATYDVTKLSFHAWLLVQEEYELLSVGAALGTDCGPVVVAAKELAREDLAGARIAVPGELTTAHLLLRLWAPEASNKLFTRYDRIMDLVASDEVDAGVLIHEGRFVYDRAGLKRVADLGQWWREQTNLPIPLGCIAARKSLGESTVREFEALLKRGIEHSLARPEGTLDYVRQHAQEMDEAVLAEHIRTFVNDYSLDIGDDGRAAVAELQRRAREAGVIE
jgi:1,4-dihydroxy-6-naphthoate synthase